MSLLFTYYKISLSLFFALITHFCLAQTYENKFDDYKYYQQIIKEFELTKEKSYFVKNICNTFIKTRINNKEGEKVLLVFFRYFQNQNQKIPYQLEVALGVYFSHYSDKTNIALDYMLSALRHREIDKDTLLPILYHDIGNIYYKMEDFLDAEKYLLKAKEHLKTLNIYNRIRINTYNTLGLTYFKMERYNQSEIYYNKALKDAVNRKDTVWIGLVHGNVGTLYYRQKKYKEALPLLEDDIKKSITFKEYANALISLSDVINIHIDQNQLKIAEEKIQEGRILSDSIKDITTDLKSLQVFYNSIYLFYKSKKEYEKALEYKEKAESMQNEADKFIKNKNIQSLKFLYEHKNSMLKVDELVKQNETQQIYIYLVFGTLLSAILVIVLGLQRYKKNKKINAILAEKSEQIKAQKDILTIQNAKINLQNDNLQTLNDTKNKLFSLISHDLRTPLVSLKGVLDLLSDNNLSLEELKQFLPLLQNSVEGTLQLTEDLLYWSGTQLEGIVAENKKISIENLINENIIKFNIIANKKNITIQTQIEKNIKDIGADKNLIKAVLRNLLSNAIKFSENNSIINIFATNVDEDNVRVEVRDTGIGIPKENIDKIFQGQTFTTKGTQGEKGTGLGLMLCRDFIALNNGKIWVESKLGVGSSFYFTVPCFDKVLNND